MNQYIVVILGYSGEGYVMANSPSHAVEVALENGHLQLCAHEQPVTVVVKCQFGLEIKFEVIKP